MDWVGLIFLIVRIGLILLAMYFSFISFRHYSGGRFQQAIYLYLMVIFMAIIATGMD